MDTFRELSNNETEKIIANRFCRQKGWHPSIAWQARYFNSDRARARRRITEEYGSKIKWNWFDRQRKHLFSAITCYK